MNRPKISLQKAPIDWILEAVGLLAIAGLILYPLSQYGNLPDTIPRHFDAAGNPDAYGSKALLWVVPVVGTLLYAGIKFLIRFPHLFNYPVNITEENAARQYRLATRLLRSMNTLIACAFCYITYGTIQTALGRQNGLGELFLPIFLTLIAGVTGGFLLKAVRKSS